ncbi:MAG: hypothetical protein ACREI3_00240 [Nitrospirales bacterium]
MAPGTAPVSIDNLAARCPDIDAAVVTDFLSRMDTDYFARFSERDILRHLRLVAQLAPDRLCLVSITPVDVGHFEIVLVAYDYFSEFAGVCGLLSAHGLDIREGNIYTSAEASPTGTARGRHTGPIRRPPLGRPELSRKKIVDVFHVRPLPEQALTPERQRRVTGEVEELIRLLDRQQLEEARDFVNRRLVETLGRSRSRFTGLLQPVQIRFDNRLSPSDTVMDIRSTDTPAFLYAFANALSLRGLYIRQARVEHVGAEVRDRFYVRTRHGGKIEDPAELEAVRVTAVLIKQFTHFLPWAPDPGKALEYFDRFLDRALEEARDGKALAFLRQKKTLTTLARLFGTSDFLWEEFLRRQHANLLSMLDDFGKSPFIRSRKTLVRTLTTRLAKARTDGAKRQVLNQFKDEEMFRIDMKHLLDPSTTLQDFSRALTELAEAVVDRAVRDSQATIRKDHGTPRLANGKACEFAVFGLGKFGGRELGYASDIEVLFVFAGPGRSSGRKSLTNGEWFERVVQTFLGWIEAKQEGIFHVDVRLRPHGGKGMLANTLGEVRRYYSPTGLAAPFERQALIKLRSIAGDTTLGRQVEAHRKAYVYSDAPWDVPTALELRRRQVKELAEPGRTNVKYTPGGLIDIEYAVQYLQLLHGHAHPALRTPNTLEAVAALRKTGVLSPAEADRLREAYLFLRTLIDGLRIVRGNAKDLVLPPTDSDEFIFLARRLGYRTEDWMEGARHLEQDIARHMTETHELFTRRFGPV